LTVIRTQISFDEEQYEELQRRARQNGVSMAAFVRQAVEAAMAEGDRTTRTRRAISAIGRLRGDAANLSEEHDRYLADAFAE
jgi:predicted urease superfamily metal-dependent hydrolase